MDLSQVSFCEVETMISASVAALKADGRHRTMKSARTLEVKQIWFASGLCLFSAV